MKIDPDPAVGLRAHLQVHHRRDEHLDGADDALADPVRGQGLRHRPLRRRRPHAGADREPADPGLLAGAGVQAHQRATSATTSTPGDVIFHNDVFTLGNQNNDVAVFKPVFFEGELVGLDRGQGPPGRHRRRGAPAATTRTPPRSGRRRCASRRSRSSSRGKLRKDVWDLIFANIRLDIVQHDMQAEIGACTVGERRLRRAAGEVRPRAVFEAHKQALFDATRADDGSRDRARSPTASTRGEGHVYYDGRHEGSQVHDPRRHRRSRTSASASTTRAPTRRPTASSTAPSPRARRPPS